MQSKLLVLDAGYVQLVESWGSDESIICAARMSTNKGFQGWGPKHSDDCNKLFNTSVGTPCVCNGPKQGDEKLLKYLYENHHDTPFEMAGMVIEVQAPIFVFREWMRHRTASYNEMSARYTPLPDMNYVPSIERLMTNSKGSNHQANRVDGAVELTEARAKDFQYALTYAYAQAEAHYQDALKYGVPKELARLVLPVGRYSRMRASANLRNWLGFLTLRQAPNAQQEIREYANVVASLVEEIFPRTYALFAKGR